MVLVKLDKVIYLISLYTKITFFFYIHSFPFVFIQENGFNEIKEKFPLKFMQFNVF